MRAKRMKPGVAVPSRGTPGASGLDLSAAIDEPLLVRPGERKVIDTGWAFEIPHGFEGQLRPRSGHTRRGLVCQFGTIDSDYRGEVSAVVINHTGSDIWIQPGDRIAQIVIAPVCMWTIEEVDQLSETARGRNGFGSTG